jgi:phosphatidylinositol alpha-1,6-mannosyltransferase
MTSGRLNSTCQPSPGANSASQSVGDRRGTDGQLPTLLVSEIFPPRTGGSGRWFWEIYRRLPREDFVIAAGEDPRQEEFDCTHDLRVLRLPLYLRSRAIRSLHGLRGYFRGLRALHRVLKSQPIGMLHCARCLPEGLMALALKCWWRKDYACYCHGEELGTASTSRELAWLTRRVLRGASFIIANSRNTSRILHEEWDVPQASIRLLHPGADTERFVPAPRSPEVRTRLGWDNRPVVLTVGRLQKRKGHDQMIRAIDRIRQSLPGVLYAVIGEGEERPPLEALVREGGLSNHVRFLGEVCDRELIECYQQCDLFVLPNRAVGKDIEGFGMVLVEAQACGKPVIAGASGGTAETMLVPDTGKVVPCDEPDELARLVVELLGDRDRLARMGQAARAWVVERFDWSALSRQAEEVFSGGVGAAGTSGRCAAQLQHSDSRGL